MEFQMHRGNTAVLHSIISFTLSLFQPVAHRFLAQDEVSDSDGPSEDTIHDYILAKAEFLTSAIAHGTAVMRNNAPLVSSFVPDFFQQLSVYWEEGEGSRFKAEQLEHSLTRLCKELEGEKATFHKVGYGFDTSA